MSDPYEREAARAAIHTLRRELAEVTKQRDELQSQLSEMTARAMSMVFMIPSDTLAGDLQKFKDECKDLLERSEAEGAAFPSDNFGEPQQQGMSLRDYFAAAALQGLLASGYRLPTHAARDAFNQADAMLQARKEGALHLKTKGEKP